MQLTLPSASRRQFPIGEHMGNITVSEEELRQVVEESVARLLSNRGVAVSAGGLDQERRQEHWKLVRRSDLFLEFLEDQCLLRDFVQIPVPVEEQDRVLFRQEYEKFGQYRWVVDVVKLPEGKIRGDSFIMEARLFLFEGLDLRETRLDYLMKCFLPEGNIHGRVVVETKRRCLFRFRIQELRHHFRMNDEKLSLDPTRLPEDGRGAVVLR